MFARQKPLVLRRLVRSAYLTITEPIIKPASKDPCVIHIPTVV